MFGVRYGKRKVAPVLAMIGLAAAGCATKVTPIVAPPPAEILRTNASAPTPYRIGPGDELDVRFPFHPDFTSHVEVRPDGRVSLPGAGEGEVAGLTPTELEQRVVEQTRSRLRNPEVVVILTRLAEQRIYVGGEVARPGYVVLHGDLTPLQAVIQAGGFKNTAELASVLLLTAGPNSSYRAVRMNMEQVVEDGVPERVRLRANDVVYVPSSWIADADLAVDQWVRGLVPAFPRVGVGYSLSN